MYTTNQIADFFASDDVDGDAVDARGLAQPELNTMDATITSPRTTDQLDDNDGQPFDPDQLPKSDNNDDDGDLTVIRKHSYLRGIRAIAALYKLFEQTVKQQVTLGVVINRVEEDSKHDAICPAPGCDPDFYARVAIAGLESRNRGDARQEGEDIDPDWMFGNTVGTSGSVPVRVEIWDEDGLGVGAIPCCADEQSDIDINGDYGDRALELNVDLGKCLRREPGAITGDASGACGERLTDGGDAEDDPSSRVSFTIIMSKSPPTAEAGGPYTTNEGTDVTLDGTASSDPDNDIVTYAWDFDGDGRATMRPVRGRPSRRWARTARTTVKLCVTDAVGLTDEDTATVKSTTSRRRSRVASNTPDRREHDRHGVRHDHRSRLARPALRDDLMGRRQRRAGARRHRRERAPERHADVLGDTHVRRQRHVHGAGLRRGRRHEPVHVVPDPGHQHVPDRRDRPLGRGRRQRDADRHRPRRAARSASAAVSTDPGSDDLTLTWEWGDGTPDASTTDLVNPPNPDPAGQPEHPAARRRLRLVAHVRGGVRVRDDARSR